jgi:hypothetical protein
MGPNTYLYEKAREEHCQDLRCEIEAQRRASQLLGDRRSKSRRLAAILGGPRLATWRVAEAVSAVRSPLARRFAHLLKGLTAWGRGMNAWLLVGMVMAVFLLGAVSIGRPLLDVGFYLALHREPPRYNYSGYSSHLPSQLRPGETLSTAWRSYAHTQEEAVGGPIPVALRTLLVKEASFKQGMCGTYQTPIVLDRLMTDDRSGFWYLFAPSRSIRIPSTVLPGSYELVQEAQSGTTAMCVSNPLLIAA